MQTEVNKLYRLMISIIEVHYIESLLQIQDEGDRKAMSLWGISERKKEQQDLQQAIFGKKTSPKPQPVEVDDDCLACGLDKYRPMIKEAFKMACVQYKPTGIPFRGQNF